MFTKSKTSLLFFIVSAGFANAGQFKCEFTNYKGARDEIAMSYLGTGFLADDTKGRIAHVSVKKTFNWISAKVSKTQNFTTFAFSLDEKDTGNNSFKSRYSFRAYTSGKCNALMEASGFQDIRAEGRLRD